MLGRIKDPVPRRSRIVENLAWTSEKKRCMHVDVAAQELIVSIRKCPCHQRNITRDKLTGSEKINLWQILQRPNTKGSNRVEEWIYMINFPTKPNLMTKSVVSWAISQVRKGNMWPTGLRFPAQVETWPTGPDQPSNFFFEKINFPFLDYRKSIIFVHQL